MPKIIEFKSLGETEVLRLNYVSQDTFLSRGIDYISKKIEQGIFKPEIDKVFSFEDTIKAYNYLLKYDVMVKITVKVK